MKKQSRIAIGIWILILTLTGMILRAQGAENDDVELLENYIDWFHTCEGKCTTKPSLAQKAKAIIPPLLKYCYKYNVDPLIMAIIFSHESSWRNFKGALGELGPGHVMPSKWSRQFDLYTLSGQIEASVARMQLAQFKCKTFRKTLTHYASGSCISRSKKTHKKVNARIRAYKRTIRKFRIVEKDPK
jgi:hypothetical protein